MAGSHRESGARAHPLINPIGGTATDDGKAKPLSHSTILYIQCYMHILTANFRAFQLMEILFATCSGVVRGNITVNTPFSIIAFISFDCVCMSTNYNQPRGGTHTFTPGGSGIARENLP